MKKIYSKKTNQLLHIINRFEDINGRNELIPSNNFLQVATIKASKNQEFNSHYHIWKENTFDQNIAQECWVVLKGEVEITYYDVNEEYLDKEILREGDSSITLAGGHGYKILQDDTVIIESKSGPYLNRDLDKKYFKGKQ